MRLRTISVRHWRGVPERTITLDPGVTVVEGPNEIGKSTLIEALELLLEEKDSSAKQRVRAIQPVGEDVGSSVEAELLLGTHELRYRKTFNRERRTELEILTPRPERLTGGDAHERVRQLFSDHVDPVLWRALNVSQGRAIAATALRGAQSLAAALDRQAGGEGRADEGEDLFAAAEAEYEAYFTARAGKPRFSDEAVCEARARVDALREQVGAIEADVRLQRSTRDALHSLESGRPALEAHLRGCEARQRRDEALQQELSRAVEARDQKADLLSSAVSAREARAALVAAVEAAERLAGERSDAVEPGRERLEQAETALAQLRAALREARDSRRRAEREAEALEAVRAEYERRQRSEVLLRLKARVGKLDADLRRARQQLGDLTIDDAGLKSLLAADREAALLSARTRQLAPRVEVLAERDLAMTVDGREDVLKAGATVRHDAQAALELHVPGVARLKVIPPATTAELGERLATAEEDLQRLLARYGVDSAAAASAALARRRELEAEVARLGSEREALLGESGLAALEDELERLHAASAAFTARPEPASSPPSDLAGADAALADARRRLEASRRTEEAAQQAVDAAEQEESAARLAIAEELQSLESARVLATERAANLAHARSTAADEALCAREAALRNELATLAERVEALAAERRSLDPEQTQVLLENARGARDRMERDERELSTTLAVVASRLESARANGLHEALSEALQVLEAAEDELAAVRRRANAAARLLETLRSHRDATLLAYVKPLRDGIERLGRIVFGRDFAVSLAQDWEIESVIRAGREIPFASLSIGTQEQLDLLTRLAAAGIVGGAPLILDDALGFADPERLRRMGAAIGAASRGAQIIVLTCHPERFTFVGNARIERLGSG